MHEYAQGGHSGALATSKRIGSIFFWKGLEKDVRNYVKGCTICETCKYENVKTSGLLQPLPISDNIWSHVSMDFIEGLPKSQGREVIIVIMDRLSNYAHFLGLKHPYTA